MANYTGTDWQPETKISTDIMATIDEGLGELNADLTDKIQAGIIKSFACAGESITERELTFPTPFKSTPAVVVAFRSASTSYTLGGFMVAVDNVSETGFTARVFNATSASRSPEVVWIATETTNGTSYNSLRVEED